MAALDQKDLAILRAMRVYPFNGPPHGPSALRPKAIAERTGLTVDFVKDRVSRMENDGLIVGYQIYPNLRHLGLHETVLHLTVPLEARKRFFVEADRMEGVVGISRFVGESACIDLTYRNEDDLQDKMTALLELAGIDVEPDGYLQAGGAPPKRELANLDWRIIEALRNQARRPFSDVAAELGVAQRTVRRRLQAMDDDNAIDVVVEPDFGAMEGAIMYAIRVTGLPGALDQTLRQVVNLCRHRSFSTLHPRTEGLAAFMVDGFAFNQAEVDAAQTAILALPSVTDVHVLHPSSVTASTTWLDEAICAAAEPTGVSVKQLRATGDVQVAD